MANRVSAAAIEEIYTLFYLGAMGNWTDSQLVAQFSKGQEGREAAFRVLIHRHGPMVLGVCRRVLGDDHAAEDAFQATFLVLVKKAGSLRDCNLLTNWLYGVALRVASKDKVKGARRRVVEKRAAEAMTLPGAGSDQVELRSVIDEEIRRLPERYRVPLVLCHVEGLRHDEVAHRLGCPVGTVESRLSRARAQLRTRLARRGLAPTASALGLMLRPPVRSAIPQALAETTLRAAVEVLTDRAGAATGIVSVGSWLKSTFGLIPAARPALVASSLVVSVGLTVMGMSVYRVAGEPPKPDAANSPPPSTAPAQTSPAVAKLPAVNEQPKQEDTSPHRFPRAVAGPLTKITIDGRLDDWPRNLTRYPINNQLQDHSSYNSKPLEPDDDPRAYFMAGYDPKEEQIYLAVVVHDDDVVVHPTDVLKTDSVEIYIDGNFSATGVSEPVTHGWQDNVNAATMPVIQYAGVPGAVSAYGDPWKANPSLVYARTRHSAAKMKYQSDGNVTTYEWSVKAFDHFPDRPTALYPGKHLGLDVAVVDKDRDPTSKKKPPTFLTWGAPPAVFKGFDPVALGELILTDDPRP